MDIAGSLGLQMVRVILASSLATTRNSNRIPIGNLGGEPELSHRGPDEDDGSLFRNLRTGLVPSHC